MPKLLPTDWIGLVAINYLLRLYERENNFVQEWQEVRHPFAPLIEQMGRSRSLIDIEHLLLRNPPRDLIAWTSDLQKLRKYIQGILGTQDWSELEKRCRRLQEQLAPYVIQLNDLAGNWNLRASWAAEELLNRDVQRVEEDAINTAGAARLLDLSDWQIQRLSNQGGGGLSDSWPINILSLYLAGGRLGLTKKLNDRLKQFERELKAAGAKEPPSALRAHTEWWFDHYVHHMEFPDIARKLALDDADGGPNPNNIRNAVFKLSEFIDIKPIERT